jgi:hypothetical protein
LLGLGSTMQVLVGTPGSLDIPTLQVLENKDHD